MFIAEREALCRKAGSGDGMRADGFITDWSLVPLFLISSGRDVDSLCRMLCKGNI